MILSRVTLTKPLAASLCTALFAALPVAHAEGLPPRKPGMWEVTVTPLDGLPPSKTKQCIDSKSDAKLQDSGTAMVQKMGGKCTKNTMTKTADGFVGEASCQINGSTMILKTQLIGDFDTAYTGQVTTRFVPPLPGGMGSNTMKLSGKFLGPCDSDMVPGDMIMDNGTKLNLDDVSRPPADPPTAKAAGDGNRMHDILRQLDDMKQK